MQHHCRNCGEIFCNACSDNTMLLPSSAKPVRVCDDCHVFLVGRYSVVQWTEAWIYPLCWFLIQLKISTLVHSCTEYQDGSLSSRIVLCKMLTYASITKSFLLFTSVLVWFFVSLSSKSMFVLKCVTCSNKRIIPVMLIYTEEKLHVNVRYLKST